MRPRIRHVLATLAVAATGLAVLTPAASADPVHWDISGSTTIAKQNLTVNIPPGAKFAGDIDFTHATMTGDATIPDLTAHGRLWGFLPYTATVRMESTAPVQGGFAGGQVQATQRFRLHIVRLSADYLPSVNMVSSGCKTTSDSVATLRNTTPIDFFEPIKFSGTFAISPFTGCGLLTPALTLLMSGGGNRMDLSFDPPSSL